MFPNARDRKFPRFFREKFGSWEIPFGNADLNNIYCNKKTLPFPRIKEHQKAQLIFVFAFQPTSGSKSDEDGALESDDETRQDNSDKKDSDEVTSNTS